MINIHRPVGQAKHVTGKYSTRLAINNTNMVAGMPRRIEAEQFTSSQIDHRLMRRFDLSLIHI